MTSPFDPLDFYYTIDANPDVWLVAGQRRVQFTAKEDEVKEWNVVLIPLRAGNALMPNVEIRAKIKPKEETKQTPVVESEVLNCETDYWSYGDAVVVVPDVGTSTVGVGEMAQRSVVWLESSGLV